MQVVHSAFARSQSGDHQQQQAAESLLHTLRPSALTSALWTSLLAEPLQNSGTSQMSSLPCSPEIAHEITCRAWSIVQLASTNLSILVSDSGRARSASKLGKAGGALQLLLSVAMLDAAQLANPEQRSLLLALVAQAQGMQSAPERASAQCQVRSSRPSAFRMLKAWPAAKSAATLCNEPRFGTVSRASCRRLGCKSLRCSCSRSPRPEMQTAAPQWAGRSYLTWGLSCPSHSLGAAARCVGSSWPCRLRSLQRRRKHCTSTFTACWVWPSAYVEASARGVSVFAHGEQSAQMSGSRIPTIPLVHSLSILSVLSKLLTQQRCRCSS
jgi:hypothetical protein